MDLILIFVGMVLLATAIAATIFMGLYAGGFWSALGFAAFLIGLYKFFTYQSRPDAPLRRSALNAFQQCLADDSDQD